MSFTVLYWILIAVMVVGIFGTFIPVIPGASLILAAVLVWSVATGFAGIGWPFYLIFAVLILSAIIDYLAIYWGVKQLDASKWSQFGAIAGIVLGFFGFLPALPFGGPLFGILFGAILGAFVGEFLYRSNLDLAQRAKLAFKVSMGIAFSSLLGNAIEAILATAAVALFIYSTWPPIG